MASIEKRGDKWRVRVTRGGRTVASKSFVLRADAERWARAEERELDRGGTPPLRELNRTSLGDLLVRYLYEVVPGKRGASQERYRVKSLMLDPLAKETASQVSRTAIASWRDRRLQLVSPATVVRELAILSHVFVVAEMDWGFEALSNPVSRVRKPRFRNERDRRVADDEIEAIISHTESRELPSIVRLAIATALRRGELLSLAWEDVSLVQSTAFVRETKNGSPRTIPLSPTALQVLHDLGPSEHGAIFTMTSDAVTRAFNRAIERATLAHQRDSEAIGRLPNPMFLTDLRFHDLRHEATSRLFELGFDSIEVALVTGHKTMQMLRRYAHLKAQNLALRMR